MIEFLGFLQPRRIYLWTCLLVIALVLSPWELISHASASSYPGTVSDEVFLSSHSARNVHGHGRSSHKRFHSDNTLKPRDDYSCSKSNPCSNGACCGAGGYCGYGDTYCGNGCLSNCDAVAECGKDAPKNATCPLNVCCSEYGFCGTSSEFCEKSNGCQSNCVVDPSPPAASESLGPLGRVIGYYEGWSSTSKCHETKVTDLPLGSLTHLNFAFAYLDPSSYSVVPMTDLTWTMFDDVTAAKDVNPSLKIYVSIGGWTFSDNDTTTQAIFGEIAADSTKRKTFATSLLSFMDWYGFDGVDIDWEYPGAPDRGGKTRDTDNYVALLKEVRSVFDDSSRDLGITFTAPSSYWYLRWFDVAGLLKYADWMNFMTYDLHGTWDQDNAIGSIIQGHTNLTEIKAAAELLWRVDTDPSQVVMGFGFYGRTFALTDSSCTTPGCQFSGGGDAGSCTDQSGYLAYYEIADILQKDSTITPIHDEEAAVLYFTWNKDQWISYDNGTTFKQKLDWATHVGLGGSLIWASDQDDYLWTAHEALLGKTNVTKAQSKLVAKSVVTSTTSKTAVSKSLNQDCYRGSECVDLGNPQVTCDSGYTLVGYDKNGCRKSAKKYGQPICCATKSAPRSCTWRGGGKDCNGQCHKSEIQLFSSSTGGGDYNGFGSESGTSKCNRGGKAFCCTDNSFEDLTIDCYWSKCGASCKSTETSVAKATNLNGMRLPQEKALEFVLTQTGQCTSSSGPQHYCCKSNPLPLENCHWVGKGDCADNTCNSSEVMLATDNQGDSSSGCNWWRNKALCCTASATPAAACPLPAKPCVFYPEACDDDADQVTSRTKRHWSELSELSDYDYDDDDEDDLHEFRKRGVSARKARTIAGYTAEMGALAWPRSGALLDGKAGKVVLQKTLSFASKQCGNVAFNMFDPKSFGSPVDTEHPVDKSIIEHIVRTGLTGVLPSGAKIPTALIMDGAKWAKYWTGPVGALIGVPPIADGDSLSPNDRMYAALGTMNNRENFLLVEKLFNVAKGKLFDFTLKDGVFIGVNKKPQAAATFKTALETAVKLGTTNAASQVLYPMRRAVGLWTSYLPHEEVLLRVNAIRQAMYHETVYLAGNVPGFENFPKIWKLFDDDYYSLVARESQNWVISQAMAISSRYKGSNSANSDEVAKAVEELVHYANTIVVPALITPKDP
ncbi:hypothetical protein N7501_010885 [Penicillium viridicatum]|nr:hypothetical protein N7501_010885 [Penicillium viridicatum]